MTVFDKLWALTGPPRSSTKVFRRAQGGLFAGDRIRFGDQLSDHGNRTRRAWRPNVQSIPLFSETLGARLRLKVTPTALGLVEQAGGIDAYLRGQRIAESHMAAALRERIFLQRLFCIQPADLAPHPSSGPASKNAAQHTASSHSQNVHQSSDHTPNILRPKRLPPMVKPKRPPPMVKPTLSTLRKDIAFLIDSRLAKAKAVPFCNSLYSPC